MKPALLLFTSFLSLLSLARAAAPATEKKPVTDHYGAVTVTDDYRWLEDPTTPETKAWTDAQNTYARAALDALPDRAAIAAQLKTWYASISPRYGSLTARSGRLFSLKFQPPKQQPLLVTLRSADDPASEKVVLDPSLLEPKGQVAIDWYAPSLDGQLVAVCLSSHGSEAGQLHVYRTETGEALPDVLPRVQFPTAGGSAVWAPDGQSLYYTRFPAPTERPEADWQFYQQIYVHRLGTPASADRYSAGKDWPRIAEIELSASRDGRWLLARVANGDGGEHAHYVLDTARAGEWRPVSGFQDGVKEVDFGCDGRTLYLRSVQGAPRGRVLRLPLTGEAKLSAAEVIVPEGEGVIEGLTVTPSYLFLSELIGGPSQVRRFGLDGKNGVVLPTLPNSGVGSPVPLRETVEDSRLLFRQSSYTQPDAWYLYDPATGTPQKTALASTSPVNLDDIEAVREFAISKDGTKVPLNILRRKGTVLNGHNPTLLTGYGGYGVSLRPDFHFSDRLWFDRGGVLVIANLRGGGEYGEEWHLRGNLTHKQNVFDDFAACAEHLIQRGYTRPEKLAVEGGSNGGLLMGAFLTQHPELARVVVSHVGIYDMLRVELEPNGEFNVTEFGTVKDPAQFQALYAYSPYHHVVKGTKYPAVLFMTGANDGRVNPSNSRKMTALLQSATGSGQSVLLRQNSGSGHGMGTALDERIAQSADRFAFLFQQLGMKAEK